MTSNLGTITTLWRKHGSGNFTRFEKKKKRKLSTFNISNTFSDLFQYIESRARIKVEGSSVKMLRGKWEISEAYRNENQ